MRNTSTLQRHQLMNHGSLTPEMNAFTSVSEDRQATCNSRSLSAQNEKLMKLKTLPGYINMNNTCFANSVLQCLAHTPILREYCKQARHSKNCFSDFAKLKLVEDASEGYQVGVGGDLPNKGNMNPISQMPVI
jgi:ubiquitin C-terminal hydrolase